MIPWVTMIVHQTHKLYVSGLLIFKHFKNPIEHKKQTSNHVLLITKIAKEMLFVSANQYYVVLPHTVYSIW